jgi:hypothetical protein
MVKVNKKLAAKLAAKKETTEAAPVDPKKKGGAPAPAPAAKKEDPPPKKDAKGKGGPTPEEEEAEQERIRKEKEEAERFRLAEIERNFDKHGELAKMGGTVYDFEINDEVRRSQHYEWLLPVYYRQTEKLDAE